MDQDLIDDIVAFCVEIDGLKGANELLAKFLKPKSNQQGNAFWTDRAEFKTLIESFGVKERKGKLFDLINFFGTECPGLDSPIERATCLLRVNRMFDVKCINFKSMLAKEGRVAIIVEIVTEIVNTRLYLEPCFTAYKNAFTTQPIQCLQCLYDTREAWVAEGLPTGGLYMLIATLHRYNVALKDLTKKTCIDLQQLIYVHPPTARFKGFGRWGCGDAADKNIGTNVLKHFKKHVLNCDLKPLVDLTECPVWWGELGINLGREQVMLCHDSIRRQSALSCFAGQPILPTGKISECLACLREDLMAPDNPLMNWLVTNYRLKYRDKTLAMATQLQHCAVFIEASEIYVSGCFGNFYIIGRIDEGVLTISSCYVATDMTAKLSKRTIVWTFL